MNQQPYMDVHQSSMQSSQASAVTSAPPSSLTHYSQYPQPPPLMQPAAQTYSSAPGSYAGYGYGGAVQQHPPPGHPPSSMGGQMVPAPLSLPAMSASAPAPPGSAGIHGGQGYTFDATGQNGPPGMKPRVTATLWEDEGSLCFQVEAKGVCVARREDNQMINGTKLLNVAGMTRGRRDGILKSEKTRHVVKIGPMHLKGVWIPFERALDFANKEKITDLLYPLFVHDIGALLYHPTNSGQSRNIHGSAALQAAERRRLDHQQQYMRTPQGGTTPASLTHHHSMSNPIGSQMQPPAIGPATAAGRPGLDRAHTFPTPPTSASSVMGMGNSGSSYEWGASTVSTMPQNTGLQIDTGMGNRSVPTTPASTPPANSIPGMPHYQTSQPYDGARQMYPSSSAQGSQYATPQQSMARMPTGGEEAEHEHEAEYGHPSASYGASRASYSYPPNPATNALPSEHISPEMTGSPHQTGSGRATPRTAAPTQWPSSYSTPQRPQQAPQSSLYQVMSDNRGGSSNGAASEPYQGGYSAQAYPTANGLPTSNKRAREIDDDEHEPYARSTMNNKLRKLTAVD